jgi:hypothetical protein
MSDDLTVFHVWQPEVAQRAYNATVLPHILQVTTKTPEPVRHSLYSCHIVHSSDEFLEFFQHMCHYTDYGWLQLRHLQTSLQLSRYIIMGN